MSDVALALQAAGLWPGGRPFPPGVDPAGGDLLPLLLDAWSAALESPAAAGAERDALVSRLTECRQRGARLTWGLPGPVASRFRDWLSPRLAWWPSGIPAGRWIGVASSRLGRELEQHQNWFATLRALCTKVDRHHEVLVTGGRSTTQRFVERCGELFGLRTLSIEVEGPAARAHDRWRRRILAGPLPEPDEAARVWLSPVEAEPTSLPAELAALPGNDRAVVALCDRLVALHVRRQGNLDRLLRRRLDRSDFAPASVFVALGPDLVPQPLASELMSAGAVGWLVNVCAPAGLGSLDAPAAGASGPLPAGSGLRRAPRLSSPPRVEWELLTHCTRRRRGPWPDEDERHYLDDLLLDRAGADHSAWASLWHIVQTRRLLAAGDMIRGGTPVVSFTAAPLSELPRLRTFRPHLGRWDFEPYGICLSRDWLRQRGARPVRYAEEADWETLPQADCPFFQVARSRTPSGLTLDWTAEQEWRHVGHLPLDELPADKAFLFVPSEAEADQLAAVSPWPVLVL